MNPIDPTRRLKQLMKELSSIDRELRTEVYRRSWDKIRLKELRRQRSAKQAEIEHVRQNLAAALLSRATARKIPGRHGQEPMTVTDSSLIADALRTIKPPIYERDQWILFRRVCTALMNVLERELSGGGDEAFDALAFLSRCGLPFQEAELLAGAHQRADHDRDSSQTD